MSSRTFTSSFVYKFLNKRDFCANCIFIKSKSSSSITTKSNGHAIATPQKALKKEPDKDYSSFLGCYLHTLCREDFGGKLFLFPPNSHFFIKFGGVSHHSRKSLLHHRHKPLDNKKIPYHITKTAHNKSAGNPPSLPCGNPWYRATLDLRHVTRILRKKHQATCATCTPTT